MRFTVKDKTNEVEPKDIYFIHNKTNDFSGVNQHLANQKLGQLEDIEEELGTDLITLFKALNNGFYYEIEYEDEFEKGFFKLNNTSMQIDFYKKAFIIEHQIFIYFKDYGKTWALTKEELL